MKKKSMSSGSTTKGNSKISLKEEKDENDSNEEADLIPLEDDQHVYLEQQDIQMKGHSPTTHKPSHLNQQKKTAMIPPTQKKNPKTPSQPKLVPLEEEDIRIIDQSHMTHLPTTNNFSAADTTSGADPSWNCFGINPRKPQTWPIGNLYCAWFCGTFWSITALMQFSLFLCSPCICSSSCFPGNSASECAKRVIFSAFLTLFSTPLTVLRIAVMVPFALLIDIFQFILWVVSFGYCFQGCYGYEFRIRADNGNAKTPVVTDWEPVTCPIGIQVKHLKSKVGVAW